jgi:hypothetical protein
MATLDEGSFDGYGGGHRHLFDYAYRVKPGGREISGRRPRPLGCGRSLYAFPIRAHSDGIADWRREQSFPSCHKRESRRCGGPYCRQHHCEQAKGHEKREQKKYAVLFQVGKRQ